MNDYIKYSGDNLAAASSQLRRLSGTMTDVAEMLSAVDTSAEWWSKIGMRTNNGGARELIKAERKHAAAIRQKTDDTISGIEKTCEIFDEVERTAVMGSSGDTQPGYQSSNNSGSEVDVGAATSTTDKQTSSKFWEFMMKVIGGSTGIGKVIEGIGGLVTAEDWISVGKGITKIGQGVYKTVKDDVPAWMKSWQASKTAAETVGKAKAVTNGACTAKWAIGSLKENFTSKFASGIAKKSTWIFSGILAAFDTAKDVQNQRYDSADDYVVKWASRTATDVVVKTTINAGLTAVVTTGLAAAGIAAGGWVPIAVGVGTAVVAYGADCVVKWASGGTYSGVSDAVSDGVVKVWDAATDAVGAASKKISNAISAAWSNSFGGLLAAL